MINPRETVKFQGSGRDFLRGNEDISKRKNHLAWKTVKGI